MSFSVQQKWLFDPYHDMWWRADENVGVLSSQASLVFTDPGDMEWLIGLGGKPENLE